MNRCFSLLPLVAVALAATVSADPSPRIISSELSGRDLIFFKEAWDEGLIHLRLGELAKEKASSPEIREVGVALVTAQAEHNQVLVQLAAQKGITLKVELPGVQGKVEEALGELQGPKFDKRWLDQMMESSRRAVTTYEAALQSMDSEIKAFAQQGLPIAKEKLLVASRLAGVAPRNDKKPGFRANIGNSGVNELR